MIQLRGHERPLEARLRLQGPSACVITHPGLLGPLQASVDPDLQTSEPGPTLVAMTINSPTPSSTVHHFDFDRNDTEAPTAISINDYALAAYGREADMSGDVWRVTDVKVTIFYDGTEPNLDAYGWVLTKAGQINRTASYSKLVKLSEDDEAAFIRAALLWSKVGGLS